MGKIVKNEQAEQTEEIKDENLIENQEEKIVYVPTETAIFQILQEIREELAELRIAFKKGFTIKDIISSLADKEL